MAEFYKESNYICDKLNWHASLFRNYPSGSDLLNKTEM